MVLSNKKLKQKLRAVSAESLSTSMAVTHPPNNESTNPDPNSKTQSLKSLLDSATQKPRLSKREKRRKKGSEVVDGSGSNGDAGNDNREGGAEGVNDGKKKRRKRKKDEDGDEGLQSGVSESGAEIVPAKKAKKSKKKKKKKNKKKENKEENNGVEHGSGGSGEQSVTEDKGVKISDSQENGDVATKVYVGGIPYYSTEDDIRSYFEGCGTITEVDCMKFPESGKFRGIAIISLKTEAAAKRALALDGADMGGLFLKIQPYTITRAKKESDFAPEIVDGYNRIYVGNLSWDITEEELRKLFSDCSISSIRFGEDKETKEFRGYAHVDFSDSLSLAMALKLDQRIVCGRPVRIRCAVPKKVVETNSRSVPTSKKADNGGMSPPPVVETNSRSVPTSEKADNGGMSSGNGKIKRRTCYECGEKGHISSACPKKQAGDPMNSSAS